MVERFAALSLLLASATYAAVWACRAFPRYPVFSSRLFVAAVVLGVLGVAGTLLCVVDELAKQRYEPAPDRAPRGSE